MTDGRICGCGQKWRGHFNPFFSQREREQAGYWCRLFFFRLEFCINLIFTVVPGELLLDGRSPPPLGYISWYPSRRRPHDASSSSRTWFEAAIIEPDAIFGSLDGSPSKYRIIARSLGVSNILGISRKLPLAR